MSDEQKLPDLAHTRKTVTLTHRQAGAGLTVGAVLLALQPILNSFQSKDAAKGDISVIQVQMTSIIDQMRDLKGGVRDLNATVTAGDQELVTKLRLLNQSIKDREVLAEGRQTRTDDRQDRSIEGLTLLALKVKGGKLTN